MNSQNLNDQLYDIYGHWHVPFWQTRIFMAALLIVLAIFILALIIFIVKKYFKKSLTPAQQALREIALLKKQHVNTRHDAHAIYFKLTDILKNFFQHYYKQPFRQLTDQEMIEVLKKENFPIHLTESLQNLVESSASVKYAAGHDLQENVIKHLQASEKMIIELENIKKGKQV